MRFAWQRRRHASVMPRAPFLRQKQQRPTPRHSPSRYLRHPQRQRGLQLILPRFRPRRSRSCAAQFAREGQGVVALRGQHLPVQADRLQNRDLGTKSGRPPPCRSLGIIKGSPTRRARTRLRNRRNAFISFGVTSCNLHVASRTSGILAKATTKPPWPSPVTKSGPRRATPESNVTSQPKPSFWRMMIPSVFLALRHSVKLERRHP